VGSSGILHIREVTMQAYASTLLKRSRLRWLGQVMRMTSVLLGPDSSMRKEKEKRAASTMEGYLQS